MAASATYERPLRICLNEIGSLLDTGSRRLGAAEERFNDLQRASERNIALA